MQSQRDCQQHTQQILSENEADGGDGNAHTNLAALLNQFPGGSQADTGEEDVHKPLLQNGNIKGHLKHTNLPQNSQKETDYQTCHNDAGNTVGLKEFDPLDNCAADHGYTGGNRRALHYIK